MKSLYTRLLALLFMFGGSVSAVGQSVPDVWEQARVVNSLPYSESFTASSNLHNDYMLPGSNPDGNDVVFKLSFSNDVLLNASVSVGENGKTAVYHEDFDGAGGPGPDNAVSSFARNSYSCDFEDGGFGAFQWVNDATYPWIITNEDAYESGFSMKSGNADQHGTTSAIQFTIDLPEDGKIHFWSKISSEYNYDKGYFYIDDVEQLGGISGVSGWEERTYDLTQGTHTFKWAYAKDGSANYGYDCFYVDNIVFQKTNGTSMDVVSQLDGIVLQHGTYYVVASSTSEDFTVDIDASDVLIPDVVSNLFPVDGHTVYFPRSTQKLTWTLGDYTVEYQLLVGETNPPTTVAVAWTANLAESYTLNLQNNKTYYWQVNERNTTGMTEGPVYSLITNMLIPNDDNVFFVTPNGSGTKEGNSWANASDNLQMVLNVAELMDVKPTVWVAEGTYFGDGIAVNNAFTMVAGVNVYGGFAGTETALSQRDPVTHPTILDGQQVQRVLNQPEDFTDALATVWDGFVIEHGRSTTEPFGAGAYLRQNGTLRNSIVRNNHVAYYGERHVGGGGVYIEKGTVDHCEIYQNSANNTQSSNYNHEYQAHGGGVYLKDGRLSDCHIHHDTVIAASETSGGGLYVDGSSVDNCTVNNCVVEYNSAHTAGGVSARVARFTNCIIANNTATKEEGYVTDYYAFVGGIYVSYNTYLTNCAIVNNTAANGVGGIYNGYLQNCVVWGNRNGNAVSNVVGDSYYVSVMYSAVEGGYAGTGNVSITTENTGRVTSPCFTNPEDDDWTLQQSSFLINRGNNEAAYITDYDMVGNARIQQDRVDIGPYETPYGATFNIQPDANNIIYVTQTGAGNKNGSSWDNACDNLALVMELVATISPAVSVWVQEGVYVGDGVANGFAFNMPEGVNVYGGFAGTETSLDERPQGHYSTLDGQNVQRVLWQQKNFTSSTSSTWDGFILEKGRMTVEGGAGAYIQNYGTLKNCIIRNDTAMIATTASLYFYGGGVYLSGGRMENCEVSGNALVTDGNYYPFGGGVYATSDATVVGCNIHDNVSKNQNEYYNASSLVEGGGLALYYATVTNCIISNNTSSYGGGVYCGAGSQLTNCIIANNTSVSRGGGVYVGSSTSILNCDIVNNYINPLGDNCQGAGIYLDAGDFTMTNSIVWGNMRTDTIPDQYSFGGYTPAVTFCAIQDGYDGTGNIALEAENDGSLSPYFTNPTAGAGSAYHGGDWTLQEESFCINQGTSSGVTLPENDFAGNARVQMGTVDIGAYESPYNAIVITPDAHGIVYVTTTGAGNKDGSSWANASDNLQLAVNRAGAAGPDTKVWVAQGTYQSNVATSQNAFIMPQNIDVYGGFVGNEAYDYDLSQRDLVSHATILDGRGTQRVLYQRTNFSETAAVVWDGFSLTNGGGDATGAGAYLRAHGELRNCRIYGNAAAANDGAVVYAEGNYMGEATLTNCLITDNQSQYTVYANGKAKLLHCGIYANTVADNGTVVYMKENSDNAMQNTVVWGNNGIAIHNPDQFNATYCAIEGGVAGVGNINLATGNTGDLMSPGFTNPAAGDWTLQANSILINKGVTLENHPTTDLAGNLRVQLGQPDLGPFESATNASYDIVPTNGIVCVSVDGNGNGSSWADACGDFQFAVNRAAGLDPKPEVWVREGVYHTALLNPTSSFYVIPGVNVYGGFAGTEAARSQRQLGAHQTILDGDNSHRVLFQTNDFTAATEALWDGFTLRNGLIEDHGGGAYLRRYSTLQNCVVKNNRIQNYRYGAGIYANHATIINCEVSNNQGGRVGGIHAYYSDVINTTIVNNTGEDYGGIWMEGSDNFTNLIIWGNSANQYYSHYATLNNSAVQAESVAGTNIALNAENDGVGEGNYVRFLAPEHGIYQLKDNSSVIGMGDAGVAGLPDKDLAGRNRVMGGGIEPGAYEQYCTEYEYITVNAGSSYNFYGTLLTEPGTYLHQYSYSPTCDSLIVAEVAMTSTRWYVTTTGAGNHSGNSWANASNDLNGIIAIAAQTSGFEDRQVWVAGGTYTGNENGANFYTAGGVKVYGGFAGNENNLDERDIVAHPTILSGESYRTLLAPSNTYPCTAENPGRFDGFTLQGGSQITVEANMTLAHCNTAMRVIANGTLKQCEFTGFNDNGSLIMLNLNDGAVMDSCAIHHNVSRFALVRAENATITRSLIYNNTCSRNDVGGEDNMMYGAILNAIDNVTIDHCDFLNNRVEYTGEIVPTLYVNMEGTSAYSIRQPKHTLIAMRHSTMSNSIIWGNEQDLFNRHYIAKDIASTIDYCAIENGLYNGIGNIRVVSGNDSGVFSVAFNAPIEGAGHMANRNDVDWSLKNSSICLKLGADGSDIGAISSAVPASYRLVPSAGNIIFVDAQGMGNGSSWAQATPCLQYAVARANAFTPAAQVWVKEGTYYGLDTDSTMSAFNMVENVRVYGGFAGMESSLADRDLESHHTFLDGRNKQRVLYQNEPLDEAKPALWDGFIIRNGYLNESHYFDYDLALMEHPYSNYDRDHQLQLHGAGAVLMANGELRNTKIEHSRIAYTTTNYDYNVVKGMLLSMSGGKLSHVSISYDTTAYVNLVNCMVNTYLYAVGAQIDSCEFSHNIGKIALHGCNVNASRFENNQVRVELPEVDHLLEAQLYVDASTIRHCYFRNNNAVAVNRNFTNAQNANTFANCIFDHNNASVVVKHSKNYNDTFINCNICNNRSLNSNAYPVSGGIFHNSVVWGNRNYIGLPIHFANADQCTFNHTAVELGVNGTDDVIVLASNNMGNSQAYAYPRFLAPEAGDYELIGTSDLVDAGDGSVVNYNNDMMGNPRVNDGTVDVGAYEFKCMRYREYTVNAITNTYPFYGEWLSESGQYVHRWRLDNIDCDSVVVLNLCFKHIIYVKENGGGLMNGKSWENAYGDLRLALEDAAQNPMDKSQIWVAEGLYRGDGTSINAFEMPAGVELYGGLMGTELADYDLSQRDIENHVTILDGDYIQRVLYMTDDATEERPCIIDGFTIKNGYSRQSVDNGTAMYLKRYCQVRNCKITENYTWNGVSAIHMHTDDIESCDKKVIFNTFENCEITNNQGEYAVLSDHTSFTNCKISSNQERGVFVVSYTKLDHCDIETNGGRGIVLEGAYYRYMDPILGLEKRSCDFFDMNGCLVKKNSKGGVLFINEDCEKAHSETNIVNCVFDSNTAKSSGDTRGGAICGDQHDINIINSTILKNSAKDDGGALYGIGFHVVNTILSGNTAGGKPNQLSNYWYQVMNCMIGDLEYAHMETCDVSYSAIEGGFPGEGNIAINNTDLLLGLSSSYMPISGSVCINHGTTEGFTVPEYDRAGASRVRQGRIDIGAYESNLTRDAVIQPSANNIIYVKKDGTGDGSSWENATSHLQMAVNFALCYDPVPHVWVKGGLYDQLEDDNKQFWSCLGMLPGVNVYGSFNGTEQSLSQRQLGLTPTILDGKYSRRVVEQLRTFESDEKAVWDGFVIKNGYGHQGYLDKIRYISESKIYQHFKDNMYGGGVLLRGGASLDNCEIRDNVAYRGGGVYRESAINDADFLRNDKICHNYAIEEGGGLFLNGRVADMVSGFVAIDTIANCEISDNTSDRHGGMIACRSYIIGSSIVHNTTELYAFDTITSGNVYNHYVNCLLWGNDSRNYAFQTEGSNNTYEYCAIQGGHEGVGNINLENDNSGNEVGKHYANLLAPEGEVYRPTDTSAFANTGNNARSYGDFDLGHKPRVKDGTVEMGAYETACIKYRYQHVISNEQYEFYGQVLTASGNYQHYWTPTGSDCDSLVSLDLEIRHIIYVKEGGQGDGSSWNNAMGDLNLAMRQAYEYSGFGDKQVWVAEGTYTSPTGTGNQAFTLYPGVEVYGGFPSNITTTDFDIPDRDLENDHTILLGNNVQRVVGNVGHESEFTPVKRATFDGFVIQNGYTTTYGGGVYAKNYVTIRNCVIRNNQALSGAGIYVTNHCEVIDCDIFSNTALNCGGGAFVSSSTLTYCHLHNNLCDNTGYGTRCGGGIYGVNATINNCLIDNNSVLTDQGYGGGMYIGSSDVPSQLLNCTMVNNYSYYLAGGIYSENSTSNNEFINCVLWGNRTDLNTQQIAVSASNVPIYLRYCAVQGGAAGIGTITLSASNTGDRFSPCFVAPSQNVGANYSGGDWHFAEGSILANHGERMEYTITHDLDGDNSARIKNGRVDIGAFESDYINNYAPVANNNVIYVNCNNTVSNYVGDSWANAIPDLQFAINFAGDDDNRPAIWIAQGVYYGNGWPYVDAFVAMNGVNLYGGFAGNETSLDQRVYGAHPTILDGQNIQRTLQQAKQDYFKYRRLEELQPAEYDGLTLRNGFVYMNNGAGLLMYSGELSNSIIENCHALNGDGGGMLVPGAYHVSASNTSFLNNKSENGNGGAACYQVVILSGGLTTHNCLFANNSALNGKGGAVYDGTHYNATIVNNYATIDGGGADKAVIYNSILWGNKVGDNEPCNLATADLDNDGFGDATVKYSAIEGGYLGEGNVTLNANNTGLDNVNYPRFDNPTIAAGYGFANVTSNNEAPSWRLWQGSLAVNRGNNAYVEEGDLDLDHQSRIKNSTVDMGCYESNYYSNIEIVPDANNIIYVTPMGSGSKNGSSWANATPYLQLAMERGALLNPKPVIWIAQGSYMGNGVPYYPAFLLPDGISLYGGFEGNEQPSFDITLRDFGMHPTIFDGQNLQQIISNAGPDQEVDVVSGITFQNGRSNRDGGAAYLNNTQIEDCRFINNTLLRYGVYGGGALCGLGSSVYRSEFKGNYAEGNGGAIYGCNLIDRCWIHGNTAGNNGGGVATVNTINNSEISFNHAEGKGGGVFRLAEMHNTDVVKNTVNPAIGMEEAANGGGIYCDGVFSNAFGDDLIGYITNSIVWGNRAGALVSNIRGGIQNYNTFNYSAFENDDEIPEGVGNIVLQSVNDGTDPLLNYVRFTDPDGGDFTLSDIPMQSMCIDAGNNATAASDTYDLAGNERIVNGIVDMGCYEHAPVNCHVPTNLGVPLNLITYTTADITWAPGGDETHWIVYYMQVSTGAVQTMEVDNNHIQLVDLDPNQEYMVKVRSVCSPGEMSSYTPAQYFSTACDPGSIIWVNQLEEAGLLPHRDEALPSNSTVLFSWDYIDGADYYDLYLWRADHGNGLPIPTFPVRRNLHDNHVTVNLHESWYDGYGIYEHCYDCFTTPPTYLRQSDTTAVAYYAWYVEAHKDCSVIASDTMTFNTGLPDLHVTALNHSHAQSGQPMTVEWTVRNDGYVSTPTGATWNDYIVLSYPFNWQPESFTNARPEAFILDTVPNLLALDPGEQYTNNCNVIVPDTVRGSVFLFVVSNWIPMSAMNPDVASVGGVFPNPYTPDLSGNPYYYLSGTCAAESFHEINECDNFFYDTLNVQIAPYPDLMVTDIVVSPSDPYAGDTIDIQWTLGNYGGVGFENKVIKDVVFMSQENTFNSNAFELGSHSDTISLAKGETITRISRFVTNEEMIGSYYFFVQTDATNQVYESLYEYNNVSEPTDEPKMFLPPAVPDLRMRALYHSSDTLSLKEQFTMGFEVFNDGLQDAKVDDVTGFTDNCGTLPPFRGKQWSDQVFISALDTFSIYENERLLNVVNDTILYREVKVTEIQEMLLDHAMCLYPDPQQNRREQFLNEWEKKYKNSYCVRRQVTVPQDFEEGWHYLYGFADYNSDIYEYIYEDNNMVKDSVYIVRPDLIAINFDLDENRDTVRFSVVNCGLGKLIDGNVLQKVYFNNTEIYTGIHQQVNMLPGDTIRYAVPVELPCNFYVNNTMRVYVETDYEKTLTNNTMDIMLMLPNPDFEAYGLTCPTELHSGQTLNLSYWVKNEGVVAYEGDVMSVVYLGYSPELNFITAIPLDTVMVDVNLMPNPNQSRRVSHNITLPIDAEGNYFFYVSINDDEAVCEGDDVHTNYIVSDSIYITLSDYPDLSVVTATAPETAGAGEPTSISYDVVNLGIRAIEANETWADKVYISNSPQFDESTAVLVFTVNMTGPLNILATYHKDIEFTVPTTANSDYYFVYVVTDANDDLFEYVGEYNNVYQTSSFPVTAYQLDIAVTSFTAPDNLEWNEKVNCSFTVKNLGSMSSYQSWTDKVFLSSDTIWNSSDVELATKQNIRQLNGESQYTQHAKITIPYGYTGHYYLLAVADAGSVNPDLNPANNVKATEVQINSIPVPDLQISDFTCLTEYPASGQPITMVYKVTNVGDGPTSGNYVNRVVYSRNTIQNGTLVTNKTHKEVLEVNEYYYDTIEMVIPVPESGNFAVYATINNNEDIFEMNRENNMSMIPLVLTLNAPGDLVVTSVSRPNIVSAGDNITISWTVKNLGPNDLQGVGCSDVVYLSTDEVFDVDDKLLGSVTYDVNLPKYNSLTNQLETVISGVPEGEYYIIIIADGRNTFYESNEDNNTYCTPNPFVLQLPILYFDHPVSFTLDKLKYKDFKLEVGYAINETALISITTTDADAVNNIYVLHNGVGDNLNFDYSTDGQMEANSELYIPRTKSGFYGVSFYGQSPAHETQQVTVVARILPFEVRSISPNQGGNTGKVTVKLLGSKFRYDMPVRLIGTFNNEVYTIEGEDLQYVNFNQVFVTFDLTNAPLGTYSLEAENYCAGSYTLHDCFEVVEGVPGQLVTNLMIPEGLRQNRYTILTLEFGNIGNVDIPAASVDIESIGGSWIGLRRGELNIHRTELTVPLKIAGEPSNVLRPGVRGTITIYCYTNGGLLFRVEEVVETE